MSSFLSNASSLSRDRDAPEHYDLAVKQRHDLGGWCMSIPIMHTAPSIVGHDREPADITTNTDPRSQRIRPDAQSNLGTENNLPDNVFVESLNGRFRDRCLNDTLFSTPPEARSAITAWKQDNNRRQPHSALGNMPPAEFAMKSTLEKQAA
ncbi:transposase [Aquibium sp. LZ166]|uniref:Transposase n=1 Tax=Aquibium pacificus TaxID=3153579 RepID=A0ABV3SLG8_9HYPH